MNAKTIFSTALVMTAISMGTVRGQTPGTKNPMDTMPPPAGVATYETVPQPLPGQGMPYRAGSPAINTIAVATSVAMDLSRQNSFSASGRLCPSATAPWPMYLQTGLYTGAGGRSLFFDPSQTDAWTIELGVANINNHAHAPSNYSGIPLNVLEPQNPASPVRRPTDRRLAAATRVVWQKGCSRRHAPRSEPHLLRRGRRP